MRMLVDEHRGVVDEHVQATLRRQDVRDDLARDGRIGQVGDDGPVERPGILVQAIQAHDPVAGRREDLAHGAAHPAGATGHEGDPRLRHRSLHAMERLGPTPGEGGAECGLAKVSRQGFPDTGSGCCPW